MKYTKLSIIIFYVVLVIGCSADKEGHFVMDKYGKFYRLTNENVLGAERYRLIELDTSIYKKPFDCN